MTNKKSMILGGLLLLIIGVALLIGGVAYRNNTQKKLAAFVPITAKVVDYKEKRERDDDGYYKTLYAAVVEYQVDGKTYHATDISYSNVYPSKGSYIKIAYNPTNPSDCVFIKSSNTVFIILLVVGGLFSAVGLVLTVTTLIKK